MTDIDAIEERLRAVERAVAGADVDDATLGDPTGELESRIGDLESTTTELESGLQAVRGYVGQVKSVDDEIERRTDAAAAAVDDVEKRVAALERRLDDADAETATDEQTPPRATPGTDRPNDGGPSAADRRYQDGGRAQSADSPNRVAGDDGPNRVAGDDGRDAGSASRRRPPSPTAQRRPAASPFRRPRTHPPAESDTHGHHDGCPYCGAAARDGNGREPGRTPQRNETADDENRPVADGNPVDDVDEQGIVARLRDAL